MAEGSLGLRAASGRVEPLDPESAHPLPRSFDARMPNGEFSPPSERVQRVDLGIDRQRSIWLVCTVGPNFSDRPTAAGAKGHGPTQLRGASGA